MPSSSGPGTDSPGWPCGTCAADSSSTCGASAGAGGSTTASPPSTRSTATAGATTTRSSPSPARGCPGPSSATSGRPGRRGADAYFRPARTLEGWLTYSFKARKGRDDSREVLLHQGGPPVVWGTLRALYRPFGGKAGAGRRSATDGTGTGPRGPPKYINDFHISDTLTLTRQIAVKAGRRRPQAGAPIPPCHEIGGGYGAPRVGVERSRSLALRTAAYKRGRSRRDPGGPTPRRARRVAVGRGVIRPPDRDREGPARSGLVSPGSADAGRGSSPASSRVDLN